MNHTLLSALQTCLIVASILCAASPARAVMIQWPVAAGNDDAEEHLSSTDDPVGTVDVGSGDLELGSEGNSGQDLQLVATRFVNVPIPFGSVINTASVQFTSDRSATAPVGLLVAAELSPDSPAISGVPFDLSSRPQTAMSMAWIVPPWTAAGLAGPEQRSADIALVLQEVIDQLGWADGNALTVMFNPVGVIEGEQAAVSFDENPAQAPVLIVDYTPPIPEPASGMLLVIGIGVLGTRLGRARLLPSRNHHATSHHARSQLNASFPRPSFPDPVTRCLDAV